MISESVRMPHQLSILFFFFFNDTATTEIYTLSLHDALPISSLTPCACRAPSRQCPQKEECKTQRKHRARLLAKRTRQDRKSTRLNSSHLVISYAVFCLKKKKNENILFTSIKQTSLIPLPIFI